MALTAAEQKELAMLEQEFAAKQSASALTPEEQAEMQALEADLGPKAKTGIMDRFKALYSPEVKQQAAEIQNKRTAELDRQSKSGTGLLQTELEQTGDALTLGYLPQIEAGVQSLAGQDYVTARDANIARLERQREDHPVPALAGNVGGVLATTAVPMGALAKGGGLIKGALKGSALAGAQGAVMNPGDVEGEVNPVQAGERFENAKSSAKLGLAVGAGAGGMQKLARGAQKLGGKMKGASEAVAFKSSGAMLKDFRQAADKDEIEKLGRFMIDENMVKAGDTYESVAQKAQKVNQDAGKKLDQVYNKATKAAGEKAAAMPGLNLAADKEEILASVAKSLGNSEGKAAALKRVSNFLDERIAEHGSGVLNPRVANDIKGAADEVINYSRNPMTKEPNAEKAFRALRQYTENKVHAQVEYLGQLSGEKGLGKTLRETNQRYGMSKRIEGIANDRLNRVSANQMFGLGDKVASGAGAVIGTGAAMASGDAPLETGLKGAGGLLLGMAGSKMANHYGTAALSRGLDRTSGVLKGGGRAAEALTPSAQRAARMSVGLSRKKKQQGLLEVSPGVLVPVTDKDTP